jgi:hypothetical protein
LSPIAHGEQLIPRTPFVKSPQTTMAVYHRRDAISVKFRDDLNIRPAAGSLTDRNSGALNPAAQAVIAQLGGEWKPEYSVPEDKLHTLRRNAEANLGKAVADLRTQFVLTLSPGADPATTIDTLNTLDIVELASPLPLPMPAPLPGEFQANQGYLNAATAGVDAVGTWDAPFNAIGAGVRICDLEYSWNFAHQDLPPVTFLGPPLIDPFNDTNHGTAVLGEMGSLNNGWGTTGIAYGATFYVAATNTTSGFSVGNAILTALGTLTAGDMILIEQQTAGPNYTGIPSGTQFGLIPVEWVGSTYNAIVTAVGNGVTVIEAAGNGSQNLDGPEYAMGNGGHWPFLLANDSGAIIVGAGGSPGGGSGDRSRLGFSCYGATVDLQGWGENVFTTGYGGFYAAEGTNLNYTSTFSGTSSASPIVTGACALLQSIYKAANPGFSLTPAQIKTALRNTGSPQLNGTNPATQNIGPRPNVTAAAPTVVAIDNAPPTPNPMTFSINPEPASTTSLHMQATLGSDATLPVQYFFDYQFGGGGHDSAWQNSRDYTDTGLTINASFTFRVKARDSAVPQHETAYSSSVTGATHIQTPTGVSFGATTGTSIVVNALGTFTNLTAGTSGLYYEMTPDVPGSGANQWVQTTSRSVTGLTPGTTYTFRIKARNRLSVETPFTSPADQATPGVHADCDGNGVFDLNADTACFVDVLVGVNIDAGSITRSDLTGDSLANGDDITDFVDCALTGCP